MTKPPCYHSVNLGRASQPGLTHDLNSKFDFCFCEILLEFPRITIYLHSPQWKEQNKNEIGQYCALHTCELNNSSEKQQTER